jgi:hypothetical protein
MHGLGPEAVHAARLDTRGGEGLRQVLDGPLLTRFARTATREFVGGKHANIIADALGRDGGCRGGSSSEDQEQEGHDQ